jgi:hypothetical protein
MDDCKTVAQLQSQLVIYVTLIKTTYAIIIFIILRAAINRKIMFPSVGGNRKQKAIMIEALLAVGHPQPKRFIDDVTVKILYFNRFKATGSVHAILPTKYKEIKHALLAIKLIQN